MRPARIATGVVLVLAATSALSSASALDAEPTKQTAPFGRLDRTVIRGVVVAHLPEVQACYEAQLALVAELTGRVVVSFTIAPDGHVAGASIHETTLAPRGEPADAVETCIIMTTLRFTFPPPEGGGPLQVNYPFVLAPALEGEGDER